MISVEYQPTTRACMHALCQRFFLAMATPRTVLAGIGRVDRDKRSTGPCCLVQEQCRDLGPCRIVDTLSQTVVMHQSIDRQISPGLKAGGLRRMC